jgi:glyoxylase-like metal-dependent hydrolase (beta-lactamase superfamily II)
MLFARRTIAGTRRIPQMGRPENLTWQVGDVKITRIPEVVAELPLTGLLPDATEEALAPHRAWLAPHFLAEGGVFPLSIHALVVDTGARRILVDTCVGQHVIPGFEGLADAAGDFLGTLAAAGYARETFDTVLCTHLHFDHVGWNVMREGDRFVPTFPNARYLFARSEWEHWSKEDPGEFAGTFDAAVSPVMEAGLVDLVDTDHVVCDEVRLVPSVGHTPGHVSVRIASRGERAFITGDMTHHPVQWAEPGWRMGADTDPATASETRRRLGEELADAPVLVIGTHYAPPTAGHLVRGAKGIWFRTRG